MKSWLLWLPGGAALMSCHTSRVGMAKPVAPVVVAAAEAIAWVRAEVGAGPYAADYLFGEAEAGDLGQYGSVCVPLASRRSYKPGGASFRINKASGHVRQALLR